MNCIDVIKRSREKKTKVLKTWQEKLFINVE